MKTSTLFGTISAFVFSLALGLSSPAGAGEAQAYSIPLATSTESVSISYTNADLHTEEGRAILQSKIKHAAEKVCGPTSFREAGSIANASHNRKCVNDAVTAAASQLDASRVASLSH
jgi:UrcA family protein